MLEINPLALDSNNRVVCMDAKFNFDDNSKFRQPDIFAMRDVSQVNPTLLLFVWLCFFGAFVSTALLCSSMPVDTTPILIATGLVCVGARNRNQGFQL